MKNRAALAEAVITVVVRDQDKSDFAKARIIPPTSSITDIISLHCAFEEFETEMKLDSQDYPKLAELIQRVAEILDSIDKFVLVKSVEEIRAKFNQQLGILKRKLLKLFRSIGQVTIILEAVSDHLDYGRSVNRWAWHHSSLQ
jgi:hypothetical protein